MNIRLTGLPPVVVRIVLGARPSGEHWVEGPLNPDRTITVETARGCGLLLIGQRVPLNGTPEVR